MMNDIWELEELLELEELGELIQRLTPRPRIFRDRTNHFDILDDHEFIKRFRLNKETTRNLHDMIEDQIKSPTDRNHAVPSMVRLLLALRFYAAGSFMTSMADFSGVCKTSAVVFLGMVTRAVAGLKNRLIFLPKTAEEMERIKTQFFKVAAFPRVIGAINCTHIRLVSPGNDIPEVFRNRKNFSSFNVQIVSDAALRILDIVTRWPGSTHDQTIFDNSRVMIKFEEKEFGNGLLLGHIGYELREYLVIPIPYPQTPVETMYNEAQIRTWDVVKRQCALWKRRFPCLSTGLRTGLDRSMEIIVATAVLHNMAINMKIPLPPDEEGIQIEELGDPGLAPFCPSRRNDGAQQMLLEYFNNIT